MSARFVVSTDVCSVTDKDGSTILHVRKGILFSAIGLASDLWTRLITHPEGLDFDELRGDISFIYPHVAKERIADDLRSILEQLGQKELIAEVKGSNGANHAEVRALDLSHAISHFFVSTLLTVRFFSLAALFQLFYFDLTQALGGFRFVHQTVNQWPLSKNQIPNATPSLSAALNHAARYYPKTVLCVQRSAALTCLLRSSGVQAETVIACRKVPFKGHAWVEVSGEVINENPKVQAFYNSVLTRC
jgi:transglutaminase superfamily protein